MIKVKDGINSNASTATTLQTTRTINGTNFNGSANITTANWGTARTLTIGSTGKSVNGSANVSWSLSEIGAAASSHTHTTVGPYMGITNTTGTNGYGLSLYGGAVAGAPSYGLMFQQTGTWGTHGSVTGDWATYFTMAGATNRGWIFKTGNSTGGNVVSISGTGVVTAGTFQGALLGNASTATTLQTARTINGTSFNGSANITTANWGTARTLTIGNTGKSVNGSANVSWTLAEIGAAAASHTHSNISLTGAASSSVSTGTHLAGNQGTAIINSTAAGAAYNMLARMKSTNGVWTFGSYGTNFNFYYTADSVISAGTNTTTKSLTLLNESGNSIFPGTVSASAFSGSLSGNATTATTLQTARTINGTSFNGSANITTANWGTARTITIGSTGKSVNGSANVSWSLAEIGAAAASHGTHVSDSGWKNLTLASGMTIATGGGVARYRKVNDTVYVQFNILGIAHAGGGATAVSKTIATLPSGYRPAVWFPTDATAGSTQPNPCRIECDTDGTIRFRSSLNKTTTDYVLHANFSFTV